MAFLVYLFVLLVAAGSVIFGLDLTQSPLQPPSYAVATNETPASVAPAQVTPKVVTAQPAKVANAKPAAAPLAAKANPETNLADVSAARAQATSDEAQFPAPATTAAVSAPNHCAVDACAAAYHSFRASDCTYQPFGSERRVCTKSASAAAAPKRVATVRPSAIHRTARATDARRAYDRSYAERDSYAEPRRDRGWAFDLFGDAFNR